MTIMMFIINIYDDEDDDDVGIDDDDDVDGHDDDDADDDGKYCEESANFQHEMGREWILVSCRSM